MQYKWIKENIHYDGSQLQPLYAYLKHGVLGDSVISWLGSCDVQLEHMVDGEDALQNARICGAQMLHFIVEVFDRDLASMVLLQRVMASIVKDIVFQNCKVLGKKPFIREGDDLYWGDRKFSISVASKSSVSSQLHFAVNVVNEGTPVKTCSLTDFKLESKKFAEQVMISLSEEWISVLRATRKVRPL